MTVEIVVENTQDFIAAEMYLFKLEFDRHIKFDIFVRATGQTWFYETQYQPEIDKWFVETI